MPNPRHINDVHDKKSEAGIIATLLQNPDFIHQSDDLSPRHFFDEINGYLYHGIKQCVLNDITELDAINISLMLNRTKSDKSKVDKITESVINEIIALGHLVARNSVSEYMALVESVMDKSFKRDILKELKSIESVCYNDEVSQAKTFVYNSLEKIISSYDGTEKIEPIGNRIDDIWEEIEKDWQGDNFIEFKFPTLNKYCKISKTDCLIFAAPAKRGKSIMLLNCLVDLLRKGKSILYIDTELDTKLFTMRLISHLMQIPFYSLRDGRLTDEEKAKAKTALKWIKTMNFTHIYMPIVEDDKILATVKKYKHKYGLDGLILDYLKGNGKNYDDAFGNAADLGKTTDLLKNVIAGKEELFVLAAVQLTEAGKVADSAKIKRNCSVLMHLDIKTRQEIITDGGDKFGTMKLIVDANRNGQQHSEGEYISLHFDGNRCTFEESLQPEKEYPY